MLPMASYWRSPPWSICSDFGYSFYLELVSSLDFYLKSAPKAPTKPLTPPECRLPEGVKGSPPSWRSSQNKKDLIEALSDPNSPLRKLTIKEIHASSTKYSCYPYKNFYGNVKRIEKKLGFELPQKENENRRKKKGEEKSSKQASKSNKEQRKWDKSKEKIMLYGLLDDDDHLLSNMSAEDIYNSYSGFRHWSLKQFKGYLKSLAKRVKEDQIQYAFEEEAFAYEQKHFPQIELGNRSYPKWGYHPANYLLKDDVESGLAYQIKPSVLRMKREEYQDFPGIVFLGHVHQEKRSQREAGYWLQKRNKDAERKRENEGEALKNKWQQKYGKRSKI